MKKLAILAGLLASSMALTPEMVLARDRDREGRVEKRMEYLSEQLDLTEEQHSQVQEILEKAERKDPAVREQINAVLTEEQKEKYAQLVEEGRPPRKHKAGRREQAGRRR